jgi:hypothetical protein
MFHGAGGFEVCEDGYRMRDGWESDATLSTTLLCSAEGDKEKRGRHARPIPGHCKLYGSHSPVFVLLVVDLLGFFWYTVHGCMHVSVHLKEQQRLPSHPTAREQCSRSGGFS